MPATESPIIRRRPDGSIDTDHYDRTARRLRVRDQRAALRHLIASMSRLPGALWSRCQHLRSILGA